MKSKDYKRGFEEGRDAVRSQPVNAPRNPYDWEENLDLYEGWEEGAIQAGICELYTNGVLTSSRRKRYG